jgi:hypothetical protein
LLHFKQHKRAQSALQYKHCTAQRTAATQANNMQAYNKQHSFTYNAELAAEYEVAADDFVGLFVNCNAHNFVMSPSLELDAAQQQFESFIKLLTTVNDEAYPVLVYMHANEFVAWYDWENMHGYITAAAMQAQAAV